MDALHIYSDLADWFPLLTAPADYAEEAGLFADAVTAIAPQPVHTVLELGSGGGNNASHLKARFELTLVDLSEEMLAVSAQLNPECRHIAGDMRSVRLGEDFDAVFLHDALGYLLTAEDLAATCATALMHTKPGGVALFVPDWTRETFRPGTSHGGHDGTRRSLRYLRWIHDPDPGDSQVVMDFAYLLREGDESRVVHDRHHLGLFPRRTWIDAIAGAGFDPVARPYLHSEFPPGAGVEMFLGIRREARP
jgi:SAM-dependent methyltransferase